MQMKKGLAILALAAIVLRLVVLSGVADGAKELLTELYNDALKAPVQTEYVPPSSETVSGDRTSSNAQSSPKPLSPVLSTPVPDQKPATQDAEDDAQQPEQEILPTTIAGGLTIRNSTSYEPDLAWLLTEGTSLTLPAEGVQILIVHTHGSEAYTPDGADQYEMSDSYRTEDRQFNVIRVGDELAARLESYGLNVVHDREIYDYPSYTGSYSRSGEAVQAHLAEHPETAIVIDLHRDALGTADVVYKTVAALDGEASSQLMMLVGTGESGLEHPNWEENLKLALTLQAAVNAEYPTLARPISLVKERYNQHLTTGSLILEVGSNGNTLQEALTAVRRYADAIGPVLAEMVEQ